MVKCLINLYDFYYFLVVVGIILIFYYTLKWFVRLRAKRYMQKNYPNVTYD